MKKRLIAWALAGLLSLCALTPALAGETVKIGFAAERVNVDGGEEEALALVASAPFARDITLALRRDGKEDLTLTLPAGETRAALALQAPYAAKGESHNYLLLKSEDYSRAAPYECRVTYRAACVYRFSARVYACEAGEQIKVKITIANPERLAKDTPVTLRDDQGAALATLAHSQNRKSYTFTLQTDAVWYPGKSVTLWVDGRAQAEDAALLAAGRGHVKSIYGVQREDNLIAFTMDCGSGADNVPHILDLLDEYGLKITFFVTGQFARNNPALLRDMAARGHEIGNHSWSHPSFYKLTGDEMLSQLERASEEIYALTGAYPTLFRPPKGDCNGRVRTVVNAAGYRVIRWTHECYDSREKASPALSLRSATRDITGGSIILSHVNADCTVSVLPDILSWYRDNGFQVVRVSELLWPGDTGVTADGLQTPAANP